MAGLGNLANLEFGNIAKALGFPIISYKPPLLGNTLGQKGSIEKEKFQYTTLKLMNSKI